MVVLLHGVLMGGSLWDTVVEGLGDRYRCVVPELPFGAHTTPMPDGADLSLPAVATLLAEFLPNWTCIRSRWSATTGAPRVSSSAPADVWLRLILRPEVMLDVVKQDRPLRQR